MGFSIEFEPKIDTNIFFIINIKWDIDTNLKMTGGPVWDHVFVCEKGHYIPFDQLHPAVKVSQCFHLFFFVLIIHQ